MPEQEDLGALDPVLTWLWNGCPMEDRHGQEQAMAFHVTHHFFWFTFFDFHHLDRISSPWVLRKYVGKRKPFAIHLSEEVEKHVVTRNGSTSISMMTACSEQVIRVL